VKVALRKLFTANKITEFKNVGNLACKLKCKWENQPKKTQPTLEGVFIIFIK
jgi:hypothetical protein